MMRRDIKKIGIVTNYANINYGSALQSYALQRKLLSLGVYCENIKYKYGREESRLARIKNSVGDLKRWLLTIVRKNRRDRFLAFRLNYLRESKREYATLDDLNRTNQVYDAFICGSDQIWAPNQFNEWYYLSFVKDLKVKIAYAPSIGLPIIPDHLKKLMGDLISRIDYISIREAQGAAIVKELTGTEPPVVLDPTLLINKDEWKNISAKPKIKGEYAFCYFLGENPEHIRTARKYCNENGLKLVVPYEKGDISTCDMVLKGVGPREFLTLISEATLVFTDSFHGTAFSVNFGKDFFTFLRFSPDDELCQNSRIYHFLDSVGLRCRLVDEGVEQIAAIEPINYDSVFDRLQSLRFTSERFLLNSLKSDD